MAKLAGAALVLLLALALSSGLLTRFAVALPGVQPHSAAPLAQVDAPVPTPIPTVVVVPGPVVARELRQVGKLIVTELDQTTSVELTRLPVFLNFGGEQIVFQATGTASAGIDLDRIGSGDVKTFADGSIQIALPPAELFTVALDEDRSFVANHELGWFGAQDPALQDAARREAVRLLRKQACEAGIDTQATQNAERAIEKLVSKLGKFTKIEVLTATSRMCGV